MRISIFCIIVAAAVPARAQTTAAPAAAMANPISTSLKMSYERVKKYIVGAADLMPADQYKFKPTPEVRSFGELVGHLADAQVMFCSAAKKDPAAKKLNAEKLQTKAELQKALAEGFAYCDKVYAESTDATLTSTMLQLFGQQMTKFTALDINVAHDNEHYGNIVTYLRLKKLTPPSSKM